MRWATAEWDRDQLVLFPQRLDDVVPAGHAVRLLGGILGSLDWSAWETRYKDVDCGRPPFSPRLLASIILYGLLVQIRAGRKLEEALFVRLDFRWLAGGTTVDHTTLCEFRRTHADALGDLFVQVGVVAQQTLLTPLCRLAFDGTRVRASNHRHRRLSPEKLQELQRELAEKYAALQKQADAEDAAGQESFDNHPEELSPEMADVKQRTASIQAALAELERIEQAGEDLPKRIPLTDPQSRISPNKEGGFAANYTPLAGVDVDSGLIVTADVIPGTDEEQHLVAAVEAVEANFGVQPQEVLADGLFATGSNLPKLEDKNVTLYSPPGVPKHNPALRDDPTQPVPADQYDRLPTKKIRGGKRRLDKAAFVYDQQSDRYLCPQGEPLTPEQTTTDRCKDGTEIKRTRYKADAETCAACPLKSLCLQGHSTRRQVSRDQFEPHRERLAKRMATDEGKQKYARRAAVGERPYAVIQQHFGVREFLLRGLDRVRMEWQWITIAFNLKKLMAALEARAGPAPRRQSPPEPPTPLTDPPPPRSGSVRGKGENHPANPLLQLIQQARQGADSAPRRRTHRSTSSS